MHILIQEKMMSGQDMELKEQERSGEYDKRKKMKTVSVIIPVYNTEKYLKECLDSVFAQNLENLEVIAVNDGSTDGSREILENYSTEHENIIVINQENKGLSAARNAGYDVAQGEYICYLDSDDKYAEDAILKAYRLCRKHDLEVLISSYMNYYDDEEVAQLYPNEEVDKSMLAGQYPDVPVRGEELFRTMREQKEYYVFTWLQMAKREFIDKNKIKFIENIIYEDAPYAFDIFINGEKMMAVNDILILRRIRKDSITHKKEGGFKLYCYLIGMMEMMTALKKKIKESNADLSCFTPEISRRLKITTWVYRRLEKDEIENFWDLCGPIEKSFFKVYIDPQSEVISISKKNRRKYDDLASKYKTLTTQNEKLKSELSVSRQREQQLRTSKSYKIGNMFVKPVKNLRKYIKKIRAE